MAPGAVQWLPLEGPNDPKDAVVIASGSNQVIVYHTQGVNPVTGIPTFYPLTSSDIYTVGDDPVSVTMAHLSSSTVPDMIITNKGSNDVSILFGSIVNGQWVGTPGPRLKSSGSGPVAAAVRQLAGQSQPSLVIANSNGTISVLPGRAQGFFDDRPGSVTTFTVPNGTGLGPITFFGPGNSGLADTGDGRIVAFNLDDFFTTVATVFTPPAGQGVAAFEVLSGEEVIAALNGGLVADLRFRGGVLDLDELLRPQNGIPFEPSDLAVLPSGEVLVTNVGLEQLFVFAPALTGVPDLESVAQATTLPGANLLVVAILVKSDTTEGSQGLAADLASVGESFVSLTQTPLTRAQPALGNQDGAGTEEEHGPGADPWLTPEGTGPPVYQLGVQEKLRSFLEGLGGQERLEVLPDKGRLQSPWWHEPPQRHTEPKLLPPPADEQDSGAQPQAAPLDAPEPAALSEGEVDLFARLELLPRSAEEAGRTSVPEGPQPWTGIGSALLAAWLLRAAELPRRSRRGGCE
jgi:hypothetical protein